MWKLRIRSVYLLPCEYVDIRSLDCSRKVLWYHMSCKNGERKRCWNFILAFYIRHSSLFPCVHVLSIITFCILASRSVPIWFSSKCKQEKWVFDPTWQPVDILQRQFVFIQRFCLCLPTRLWVLWHHHQHHCWLAWFCLNAIINFDCHSFLFRFLSSIHFVL